jgi:hypothetical protein
MAAAHGEESIRGVKGEKKKSRFSVDERVATRAREDVGKFWATDFCDINNILVEYSQRA